MKRILVFTFLGPPLGALIAFSMLLSIMMGTPNNGFDMYQALKATLVISPLYLIVGYRLAIIPALLVGVVAYLFNFKRPIYNYLLLILTGFCIYFLFDFFSSFYIIERGENSLYFAVIGALTTSFLGYFTVYRAQKKLL